MLVAVLVAASAAATPQAVTPPAWLKRPTAVELQAVWPREAAARGASGVGTIVCQVNVNGSPEACRVVSEDPPGMGFGAAALLLAPSFAFRPAMGPDGPVEASVRIPVRFERLPNNGSTNVRPILMVARPIWEAAPSFAEVAAAHPKSARELDGRVVLRCGVTSRGRLASCRVLTEIPAGKGFAGAALSLTHHFQLKVDPSLFGHGSPIYITLPLRLGDPESESVRNRQVSGITWSVDVQPATVAKAFPPAAAARGLKFGRGTAECIVAADGALHDCTPLPGDPPDAGFSEAAVVLASALKMNLWTQEGGPVDGAKVKAPFSFTAAPPPKEARSP